MSKAMKHLLCASAPLRSQMTASNWNRCAKGLQGDQERTDKSLTGNKEAKKCKLKNRSYKGYRGASPPKHWA